MCMTELFVTYLQERKNKSPTKNSPPRFHTKPPLTNWLLFTSPHLRVIDLALNQAAKPWFHQYLDPLPSVAAFFPKMLLGDKSATLILPKTNSSP